MKRHKIFNKGFSLAELGIALVILLIIATIAMISFFTFIDDSKLTKMKEDASSLQEAVSIYYAENGFLSVGEEVELSEETKEIVSDNFNGECTTDMRGSVVSFAGKEINSDGLVYSGIYSGEVDGDYVDLNLKAYTVGEDLVSEYFQDKTVRDFDDYLIIDCGNTSVVFNPGNSGGSDNTGNDNNEDSSFIEPVEKITVCPAEYDCIYTVEDLDNVRDNLSGKYLLMNNLDLSGIEWEPIGIDDWKTDSTFKGEFNGNGYVISNLTINKPNNSYIGLFGYISGAVIKNLGMENVNIVGMSEVGGLVGSGDWADEIIHNNYVTGTVTSYDDYVGGLIGIIGNSTISSNYFIGDVIVEDATFAIGGLVGYQDENILTNSYSKGTVMVNSPGEYVGYVGGLVGQNDGKIENSYSMSNINVITDSVSQVGGLAGGNTNGGEINNSYALGDVEGDVSETWAVGGLVGQADSGFQVSNSFATGDVKFTEAQAVGGLIGEAEGGIVYNSYATGNVSGIEFVGGLIGYSDSMDISNTYSIGLVTALPSNDPYYVPDGEFGGLIGYTNVMPVNSYWDIDTSGFNVSNGGEGKSSIEMKKKSTFNGWDFDIIWTIDEGNDYPKLR